MRKITVILVLFCGSLSAQISSHKSNCPIFTSTGLSPEEIYNNYDCYLEELKEKPIAEYNDAYVIRLICPAYYGKIGRFEFLRIHITEDSLEFLKRKIQYNDQDIDTRDGIDHRRILIDSIFRINKENRGVVTNRHSYRLFKLVQKSSLPEKGSFYRKDQEGLLDVYYLSSFAPMLFELKKNSETKRILIGPYLAKIPFRYNKLSRILRKLDQIFEFTDYK